MAENPTYQILYSHGNSWVEQDEYDRMTSKYRDKREEIARLEERILWKDREIERLKEQINHQIK